MRCALFCGAIAASAAAIVSASPATSVFQINGQDARDIARSSSVFGALNIVVGPAPREVGQLTPRQVQEEWMAERLGDSSTEHQLGALLLSGDVRSSDPSASSDLALYTVDDASCTNMQADPSSSTSYDTCDDVYTDCHQSCTRGLWYKPMPGTCQLVCGMARERCSRCSYQRHKSFIRRVCERISSSCAALMMWIVPDWWLSSDDWALLIIALTPGVIQAIFMHQKLEHMLKLISDADLRGETWVAVQFNVHHQDKSVQADRGQEGQRVDAMVATVRERPNVLPIGRERAPPRIEMLSDAGPQSPSASSPPSPLSGGSNEAIFQEESVLRSEEPVSTMTVSRSTAQQRPWRSMSNMSVYEYVSRAQRRNK